jgi:hypothetical protein
VEFFFEAVIGESKCDCRCLHFDTITALLRAVFH